MKAIETKGLSKRYGPVRALRNVSFSVDRGEVIGLLGPNGAGKTTLMKILTGFLQPDEGDAQVSGTDVVDNPLAVQRRIGYLPENAPLYGEMAVQEYLLMMAALRGIPEGEQRKLITWAVDATGLRDYLTRIIGKLSKGYRQRVGIAQAILHRPELLILDEPTSGLDPTQIVEIRDLIKRLSEHSTVLLSTHILPEVEMTCERVLIIIKGKLRADSQLDELRAAHAAVVAIDAGAGGVRETLAKVKGADAVEEQDVVDGFRRWRVTSTENRDLCPAIFDAIRGKDWRVAELRSDARTLESVFRELADAPDVDDDPPADGAAAKKSKKAGDDDNKAGAKKAGAKKAGDDDNKAGAKKAGDKKAGGDDDNKAGADKAGGDDNKAAANKAGGDDDNKAAAEDADKTAGEHADPTSDEGGDTSSSNNADESSDEDAAKEATT